MSDLSPHLGSALDALGGADPERIPRGIVRAVSYQQGLGLIQASRVEARAHVARTALLNVAALSCDEASLCQLAPHAENRPRAITDAYAIFAAREVGRP